MILAKQIGSLDNFSNGRFSSASARIVARGDRAARQEGATSDRWTQTAEYVAAMRALWTKGRSVVRGQVRQSFRRLDPIRAPRSRPRPPVLLGSRDKTRSNVSPSGATDGARFGSASTR